MEHTQGVLWRGRRWIIAGGDGTDDLEAKADALNASAAALLERLDTVASAEDIDAVKTDLAAVKAEQARVNEAQEQADRDAEIARLRVDIDALKSARSPRKYEFSIVSQRHGSADDIPEPFAVTVWRASKFRDPTAMKRLDDIAGKALGEGTTTAGGYLVPPQYIQDLVALRRASAPLRDFVTVVPGIRSNAVYVPRQTAVETVAWTAENAAKTSSDETFSQVAVNIYTLAGIAKISNQLLEDSAPAVDNIIKMSLARGLGIEEDRAMINGSGTGQPTGILNTSGVTVTAASAQTALSLYDDILAAIARVQAGYFGQPDCIVMAPRTWAKMLTAKDTTNRYLGIGTVVGVQTMSLPGIPVPTGAAPGIQANIFGIPVVIDANMPVALTVGANSDRSAIIVGALKESWLLERDGVRLDVSDQAGTSWESNQTWFRGEERVGFTAARLTSSIQVVNDIGP